MSRYRGVSSIVRAWDLAVWGLCGPGDGAEFREPIAAADGRVSAAMADSSAGDASSCYVVAVVLPAGLASPSPGAVEIFWPLGAHAERAVSFVGPTWL